MEMSGSRQLPASQADVWRKLNDVDVLRRCIPGCESLEKTGENDLKATVALRLGPMAVRFNGEVQLQNLNPPSSYRIAGQGKGGPAGFASGHADVTLAPKDGGTQLSYAVQSTVGGKIAQLGARLIDATAAQLADDFFNKFAAEFQTAPAGSGMAAAAPKASAAGSSDWIWYLAAGALALAVLYYLLT